VFLMKKPFVPPDEPTVLNRVAGGTMYQGRVAGTESQEDVPSGNHEPD